MFDGGVSHRRGYGFPLLLRAGTTEEETLRASLELLVRDADGARSGLCFCLLNEAQKEALSMWASFRGFLPISWSEDEDDADYLYDISALSSFAGSRYSRKRNWVRRFHRMFPNCSYGRLSSETVGHARLVAQAWFSDREERSVAVPNDEREMLFWTLDNIDRLPVFGGVLYAAPGVPAAMIVASSTSRKTCDIHYEKASASYTAAGAMPVINQLFALRSCPDGCTEVNMEEDLGLSGLRVMKQSYFPKEKLKKYSASLLRPIAF